MNIFDLDDYLAVLRRWLESQPAGGRGMGKKIAKHLRVSTVLVSQVLNGTRVLQPHHAFEIASLMSLPPRETEYFLLLVRYADAANEPYRAFLKKQLRQMRESASVLKNHVAHDIQLSEEAKARFYAHWMYSAIRLLTDVEGMQTPVAISEHLKLPVVQVGVVLAFLVEQGLCVESGGVYKMNVKSTHLESESPWIYSRQMQWRHKAIQHMESPDRESLFYTGPMVLSVKDREWVREKLIEVIREVTERVRTSPSETLCCLNIDWIPL